MNSFMRAALLLLPLTAVACQSPQPVDYGPLLEYSPHSILVLPPLNHTMEVDASYGSLSTLTQPLAERGYYVFPVALVDSIMRSNGLPTPAEMHQVPLSKLYEIFAPDAVLYVTARDWGTSYQVVNSQSAVSLSAVLVDARTGTKLWSGEQTQLLNSGSGQGSLITLLASAVVRQVAYSLSDPSRDLSASVAHDLFVHPGTGLLPGPRHPDYSEAAATAR